jgi:hypothetical protein
MLQAGDYPEPLPTSEALPTLWKNYNAWLKPIRNPQTGCFHITTLSEDQYFDKVTTRMWYERMDAGAVWPPTVEAYEACFEVLKREAAAKEALPPQATTPALMAHPSQPCPKAGLWFAPRLQNQTVRMQLGEPMPMQTMAPSGAVIWYYKLTLRSPPLIGFMDEKS